VKARTALLLSFVLLATAAIAIETQLSPDPLALFRGPDGRLTIPGGALTPQLQRLLFHGNDLQPYYDLTFMVPEYSSHPTARLVSFSFQTPNLNVYLHNDHGAGASGFGSRLQDWFPPVQWHHVAADLLAAGRGAIGWFFDLFTVNARADVISVDSTTVTLVDPPAATCTTSQTALAGANAVLVMLSDRDSVGAGGPVTYASVTYGPVSLSLIAGAASSGTGFVRAEMWFYQGMLPAGLQTMTATLSAGTAKHVCATVLLRGVSTAAPTTGGTSNSATSTNPTINISPVGGELAFAVLAIRLNTAPTAVTGTGAAATSLYGIAPTQCTGSGFNLCGAGASMPSPGTAITWTDGNNTDWVVSAVRVVPAANCSVAGGNCYRVGAGGAWNTGGRWSNTSGGAACGCTPVATNNTIFNASPSGTTTLAAGTTIASIDMTGFTGTLDTTASNWFLTVNGSFAIQSSFVARNSVVTVTGNVTILTATSFVDLGGSVWTVNGTWTNLSTSASWVTGASAVTIQDPISATLTFAALGGAVNEFNNLTLDASVTTSITYTMATNPLRMGGTLTIRNSTGGATGWNILTTSGANLGITTGGLTVATFGALTANASVVSINGNVSISTANGYLALNSSTWTVTGTWTNASTSASWAAGTGSVTFNSATGGTMTFAGANLPGSEFNNITFSSTGATAQTFTMSTRALNWAGTLIVSDGSSTTAFATANLGLTGGALNVGNGGILTTNASTVTVTSVTMTGGASGMITLTTGSWTDSGNWNTSGAGSVFTKGTSTVTMTGVSNITILNAANNFNNLTISAPGTVTQTGLVDVSGILTVNVGAVLASSTFALTVAALGANMAGGISGGAAGAKAISGNVSIAATGFFAFGAATWTLGGSWTNASTSASWSVGTGTVVFNSGVSRVMTFGNLGVAEFNNVQFSPTAAATFTMATNGIRWAATLTLNSGATLSTANLALTGTGGNLTVNDGAILTAGASTVGVANVTMTGGTSGTITTSGSWTVAGNWDTSGAGSTLTATASTVIMNGAARTVRILDASNGFGVLTISGTVSAASLLVTTGLLTVSGTLDTTATNYSLSIGGGLTVNGAIGVLRTNASTVTVAGNVSINNPAGYITSTAPGVWTASGSWTNASTSASWSFAASITFNASSSQTMTFANQAPEFGGNVTFNSGASTVSFTMATNGLRWSGTLTVQGGSGTTTLVTSNLSLIGGALTIGNAGFLVANASTTNVSSVIMTGGASGTITLTSGGWTVTGNWDTSGVGSSLIAGTSTITLTGASTTLVLATGQMFYNLVIGGTIAATSTVTVAALLTVNNGGVLTKTGQSIAFNGLTEIGSGSLSDGAISVTNFSVTNSDATNLTTISVFTTWTVDTQYTWTDSSTVGTSTITFTIGANTVGFRFNVSKDGAAFANGIVNGSGQVVFTMLGSDPVVDVTVSAPCGAGNRYWIGGTGNWSQTTHWSSSSGGVNGCSAPNASNSVFFDANSGGGTVAVDLNAAMSSLTTTGWAGIIAVGVFDFAVSGSIVHAGGTLTIGASAASGLTANGGLTLSGAAVLDGSGAPSLVGIAGDTSISSAAAYFKMGSATWTFGGSWTNNSTSANWDPGTGTVVFTSTSSQTMTFAALAAGEFSSVTFRSTAASGAVTFSMSTNGLRWNNLLTIQDSAGSTTTLATANLSLTGGSIAVGDSGILAANASTVSAVDVTMNGGTSGTITLTSGAWTVGGNWDTSGAGATFTKGSSTVILSGAAKTIRTRDASNGFHNLTISGTIAQNTPMDVGGNLSVSGTLTTFGNNITGGASLVVAAGGALTAGGSTITVRSIDTSAGAFTAATSTIIVNASGGSIRITQPIFSLTVAPGISTTFSSNVSWAGTLTLIGTTIAFNGNLSSTGPAVLILDSASISIAGSWDSSSATTFSFAGSSVTFTGASQAIAMGASQSFATLTIAGSLALTSNLSAVNLTVAPSGMLTKTSYGITFNGLSVNGTIADGSVNVSNLTVTNSDATALVTITVFSDWTVGTSYAWTHSSSETTQTITWTIGGNTVRIPFTVTKDGSPFASGTVDDAGQVVFTMLGSDPNMRVTVPVPVVIPPPSGGWWQTPYLFLILPGIFLGVAMFAQRQRWRPAKAFLVDERGRLLREFTLDPSCQVTYDQAVQAGVLDAVEKPIKVSKYHGQTVRGDALAVVLLAYGPVTIEQVEFAREMLVQVQDKFEDAVKQRLEEARIRETQLDAQAKELEERRVGVETRTGELDTVQHQIDEERSRIESDQTAINAKDEDLKGREAQLAENRNTIDNLARELETLRTDLAARTGQVQAGETELTEKTDKVGEREAAVGTIEAQLNEREQGIAKEEERLATERERLIAEAEGIQVQAVGLETREAAVRKDLEDLAGGRAQFEIDQKDLLEFKRSVDTRVANAEQAEAAAATKTEELTAREARVAPFEAELATREARIHESEEGARQERARAEAALQEVSDRTRDLEDRETALKEDRVVLEEARGAYESERREFQDRTAQFEDELRRRREDLDAQGKEIGEHQLRIAQEKESFEATRNEKNQAILSREIEVEAKEQSLKEKEEAIRAQAEDNAQRLTDLASREEALEIEAEKTDKVRKELDSRAGELANVAADLDGKATRFRETEATRAEELRTWQTTLESQQALLKEQRETFEQESVSQREAWAARVMRLERREIEVKDQEEKVHQDVEWIAQNEEEVTRREKAAQEASRSASLSKEETERLKSELEQRTLEIDSRERGLREEIARHAGELSKRTDALNALETEIGGRRTELEKDRVAQTQRIHQMDADLQRNAQDLEAKARDLSERETRVTGMEENLRSNESRLEQERAAVQETGKQLESHQLELAQLKDRYESESARVRTEAEALGQSLAIKESELRAERDRIERDATALQDTLGAKAKELSIREKAVTAQEADVRAETEDLDARTRELESRESQAEARLTELSAQAMAFVRREQDMNARDSQFDQAAKKFHSEETEKRKQWESQQTTLRSQQAQLNATTESQAADLAKRAEDIEGRERTLRATATQLELERSKLEAQAKAHAAKGTEAEASWRRSEGRLAELKAKEDELLRARQSFESERSVWSSKRTEELKQLEATRDAAAVQAQQVERLSAESQRRTLVAEEAEKAAKRQAADLVGQQAALEKRRSEADKAERAAQTQLAQLQEKSRDLAAKETEIKAALRDLETRQARTNAAEKEAASASAELRTRKATIDQESSRIASLTDQMAMRQKDLESRTSVFEAKFADVTTREQTLSTELQRADNLMEDLAKKDRDLRARVDVAKTLEAELAEREASVSTRDVQLSEGLRGLEKARQESENHRGRIEEDLKTAGIARNEAEKLRVQADAMQAEVSKNLRFLQKKALDVLDREEKLREREIGIEQKERSLDARAEILEGKQRAVDADQSESDSKTAKLQAEIDRLKTRLAEFEKGVGPSPAAMEEWKKDVENRVKIIQKKAMDLLDREQKLRQKEEELRALAQQLGATL